MDKVWVAEFEFETDRAPTDDVLQEMSAEVEDRDWSVSALGPRPGIRVMVYLDSLAGELMAPLHVVPSIGEAVGEWVEKWLPDGVLGSARLVTEQQLELEALAPQVPELMSASDVAQLLGISRQRVWQLVQGHQQFPAPIARVASGPLWTRDAVNWFRSVWDRKAGRPRVARLQVNKRTGVVRSRSVAAGGTARTARTERMS